MTHDDRRVPEGWHPQLYLTRLMRGGEYMDCWPGNEVSAAIRDAMRKDSMRVHEIIRVKNGS